MPSSTSIRGRCLCGAVTFEMQPPTDFVAHCHCESCRLAHAAPVTSWTSVPIDRFTWTNGEDRIRWYRSSKCILWGFCKLCGSSMFYRADGDDHPESPRTDCLYVAVGSLIDPLDRAPQAHVSFEEHVAWMAFHDDLPRFRGKTDERLDAPHDEV